MPGKEGWGAETESGFQVAAGTLVRDPGTMGAWKVEQEEEEDIAAKERQQHQIPHSGKRNKVSCKCLNVCCVFVKSFAADFFIGR